ncbi:MAG: ribonuclease P protein subunit [Candidatus Micrarchaeota archaeon]|nr:ribonuclease P protein subunit [Candidatus Micrarchaeota archaeon]
MEYDNKNIVLNELIGLRVKVVKSLDKKQAGTSGTVIDETKNTIVIEARKGTKKVIKKISVFKFYSGKHAFIVDGKEINFRPDERIEKGLKFYKRREI